VSAIAGVFARRGAIVDRALLARVSADLRTIGPDGEYFAYTPRVGMAYRPFHTTRESRTVTQPLATGDGFLLCFDGRLDNAAEARCRFPGARDAASGAAVVLAAYRDAGLDALPHLVGDFAFALWDAHAGRLVLCADSLGRRPLYYRCTGDFVWWASRCRALVDALDLPGALDESYVAAFLAGSLPSGSPFTAVQAVSGGHVVIATPTRVQCRRYWTLDPGRQLRYRSDAEYEEHFSALFHRVVADRLDSDAPVTAELSGGVDSSSIACVGSRLVGLGTAAPALHTVSYVFGHSATADETPFINMVEDHLGRPGIRLDETDIPFYQPLPPTLAPDLPTNKLVFLARFDRVAREMAAHGSRVLLSGEGGDQLFLSTNLDGIALADLVARGRVVAALRSGAEWSRELKEPLVKLLWRGACLPLLPRAIEARIQDDAPVPDWLAPDFVKRSGLDKRLLPMADDVGFKQPSASRQYGLIRRSMRLYALESCTSTNYVDIRYPYLDRRLIEFSMSLPLEQKLRPHETRSIVRRALRGIIPEGVLRRKSKMGPTEALYRGLATEWPRLAQLFDDPRITAQRFVERDAFRTALTRARYGLSTNAAMLLSAIALELWLRQLEVRPSEGDTAPPGRRQALDSGEAYVQDLHTT
jgi:asparagine synthase (glutamine-hydrolysing)